MTTPTAPVSRTTRYESAWSESATHITAPDETPPPVPSAAQTAAGGAGAMRVRWDGLGAFGESMPVDLEAVEVHISLGSGFTPTSPADRLDPAFNLANDTFRANLTSGLTATLSGLPAGTYFVKLVARDITGNRSEPSAQVTRTVSST